MSILIFAIIVLIVAALVIYLVDTLGLDVRLGQLIKVLVILVAILLIINRSGLL